MNILNTIFGQYNIKVHMIKEIWFLLISHSIGWCICLVFLPLKPLITCANHKQSVVSPE